MGKEKKVQIKNILATFCIEAPEHKILPQFWRKVQLLDIEYFMFSISRSCMKQNCSKSISLAQTNKGVFGLRFKPNFSPL